MPGELTLLDLLALYHGFCKELPAEAIQRTKGRETRKGYDTDGYGYQYCIDVLNNVAGLGHWRIISEEVFCDEGEYSTGRKAYEVGYDVIIQLGNWTPGGFQVLAETPKTPGGHVSALKADARKGALTNAIKKAIAFFGIGAATAGTDDDNSEAAREPGTVDRPRRLLSLNRVPPAASRWFALKRNIARIWDPPNWLQDRAEARQAEVTAMATVTEGAPF